MIEAIDALWWSGFSYGLWIGMLSLFVARLLMDKLEGTKQQKSSG